MIPCTNATSLLSKNRLLASQVLPWTLGSLARARWADLTLPALALLLGTLYLVLQARALNALLMGDESATGLGIDVAHTRRVLFVVTSLITGVLAAVSGSIGFEDDAVPVDRDRHCHPSRSRFASGSTGDREQRPHKRLYLVDELLCLDVQALMVVHMHYNFPGGTMKLHQLLNLVLILLVLTACQPVMPATPASSTTAQTATADAPAPQGNNPQECITDFDAQRDYFPDKVEALYTEQWSVTYHNHYKVITIDSTYDNPATEPVVERYVLVQCGTPTPEELAAAADTLIIEVPVRRMIEAGGGVLGAIELLDLLDPLVAWRDQFTTGMEHLPKINAKYTDGALGDIGEYGASWEATLDFEPDLLIAYDDRATIEEARSLGVPYVFFSPFSEGPLGSAEQLKFVALFFNDEAKANDRFNSIEQEYLRLRDLAQAQPEKPTVLLGNLNGQGAFSTRPYNRLESLLIEDAGGVRLLDEALFDYSGFFPSVSVEFALEQGANADYWFSMAYLPTEQTAAEFIASDPINGEFQALRAGNMFHRFGRDEDYFRTAAVQVDELLADIISILHPDLLPDHELIHLERVPGEE